MCCGGTRQRLVGMKTTGCNLSYGLDFLSQMQPLRSDVWDEGEAVGSKEQETITDQKQVVDEAKRKTPWENERGILLVRGCTCIKHLHSNTLSNIFSCYRNCMQVTRRELALAAHLGTRASCYFSE